ncbi:MAG: hypothetical protein ACHP7K_01845 [Actinomycetales bacterium]|jgi:hypothetical protein
MDEQQEYGYRVTYRDSVQGRVRHEDFDDAASAERFAALRCRDDEDWAVIDPHPLKAEARAA